ncbi:MAG: ClbS/DfsB family four-helix bundle protein [Rickettsiaceae bacterium]|nr:ClbS/DfsB family four-helix bundle protein [Rickettsiaceae bacterium]
MNVGNNDNLISCDLATKDLSKQLIVAYNKLSETTKKIPAQLIGEEIITKFEKNNITVSNVLSYLIGWANFLVSWYEKGKQHKSFIMPGEGFSKWEYEKIAYHFYGKYEENSLDNQLLSLKIVTQKIISIIEVESCSGNIDRLGVWHWCTLKSGKQWPLKKWIVVNSLSPYKRALARIKATLRDKAC